MDFQNSNGVWKLERYCRSCILLIFNFFVSVSFIFSLNVSIVSIILISRSVKPTLKRFVFNILLIGDHSSAFYLLITKFEVCKPFSFKLEHFENDVTSAWTFSIPLTLN